MVTGVTPRRRHTCALWPRTGCPLGVFVAVLPSPVASASAMSNLVAIPLKRTYEANVKDAVRLYIHDHTGSHPDALRHDIAEWEKLRRAAIGMSVHANRARDITGCVAVTLSSIHDLMSSRYHAQLLRIQSKLPADVHVLAKMSRNLPISS